MEESERERYLYITVCRFVSLFLHVLSGWTESRTGTKKKHGFRDTQNDDDGKKDFYINKKSGSFDFSS